MIVHFYEGCNEPSFSKNLDCIPPIGAGVTLDGKFFRVEDVNLSLDNCEYCVLLKEIENETE